VKLKRKGDANSITEYAAKQVDVQRITASSSLRGALNLALWRSWNGDHAFFLF